MVRTLAVQTALLWPFERGCLERAGVRPGAWVVDLACGPGDMTRLMAAELGASPVIGIDLSERYVALARERLSAAPAPHLRFETGDATRTGLPDAFADVTTCRLALQTTPARDAILAEMRRITRPGGHLYTLSEDYDLLLFDAGGDPEVERFFPRIADLHLAFGSDMRFGRRAFAALSRLGCTDVAVEAVLVDTARSDRALLATLLESWKLGWAAHVASLLGWPKERVEAVFERQIACARSGYAAWICLAAWGTRP